MLHFARLERLVREKHSSLLGQFITYEEKSVVNTAPVSDLDRYMHRSLWVYVAHSSFIEGSHITKNTASDLLAEKFWSIFTHSFL